MIGAIASQLGWLDDMAPVVDAGSDEWHTPLDWLRAAEVTFGEPIALDP